MALNGFLRVNSHMITADKNHILVFWEQISAYLLYNYHSVAEAEHCYISLALGLGTTALEHFKFQRASL